MARPTHIDISKCSYESEAGVQAYDHEDLKWTEQYVLEKYFKAPGKILDIGCGVGRTSVALAKRGLVVDAIDYAEAMIRKAKEKYVHTDIVFQVMNAKDLKYPDNYFDYVFFSFNGIDYLYPESDRRQALSEIHRVLKPGGFYVFSTHNALFIPNNFARIKTVLTSFLFLHVHPYRLEFHPFGRLLTHYISVRAEKREIARAGFSFVELVSKYGKDERVISRRDPYPTYVCQKI